MEDLLEDAAQEGGDPPNVIPGQLPTKKEQPSVKDYTAIKSRLWTKLHILLKRKLS